MARSARHVTVLVALAIAAAGCGSAAVQREARPHRVLTSPAPAPSVYLAPSAYLAAARAGVTRARAWWDPRRGWYDQYLPATGHRWRATL